MRRLALWSPAVLARATHGTEQFYVRLAFVLGPVRAGGRPTWRFGRDGGLVWLNFLTARRGRRRSRKPARQMAHLPWACLGMKSTVGPPAVVGWRFPTRGGASKCRSQTSYCQVLGSPLPVAPVRTHTTQEARGVFGRRKLLRQDMASAERLVRLLGGVFPLDSEVFQAMLFAGAGRERERTR